MCLVTGCLAPGCDLRLAQCCDQRLGFCSSTAFLFVREVFGCCFLGFSFQLFPVLLFLVSPLGLQPSCLFLGLLPGFGLFHSLALFRRYPRLVQRFDNPLTEMPDLLSDGARLNIVITQGTPIDVLTVTNSRENGIIPPFSLALERGD